MNEIQFIFYSLPDEEGKVQVVIKARDKMMLDILFGVQPHFLGEKITIP